MPLDPTQKNYDPARMIVHENMHIPQLGRKRHVRVYLPANYDRSSQQFPVMYMHDGQNVFEPELCIAGASWQVAEQLDELQAKGESKGFIVVAIDCSQLRGHLGRRDEYSPWTFAPPAVLANWEQAIEPQGGDGDAYCDFIVQTLKPYIDSHYRTLPARESTIIAGSSMGGFISLYAALRYQDTFSKAGVFSPAFWFAAKEMRSFIEQACIERPIEIYMDIGTHETSDPAIDGFPALYHELAVEFAGILNRKSRQLKCHFDVDNGGIHSESAWANRFLTMVEKFNLD
ncbi:alpha/beta hydrolase-fold protein (plasmid) [Photobacterium sp. DA100]|uniref:alpha/beta hydrolase n=1 Tax=Photobacterium sp. DA100 TaxID=3027472 RepID=UPI00247B1673|nr:alpha/beta hydrolase-fold protein [Photobacterium sp. DA100]WEM44419.1 alpha/beta hydrolase-fold protein [Photobacterium sp. DA100]